MELSDFYDMDFEALRDLDVNTLYEFEGLTEDEIAAVMPAQLAPRECLLIECLIDNISEAIGQRDARAVLYWFEVLRRVLIEFGVTDSRCDLPPEAMEDSDATGQGGNDSGRMA